LLRKLQKKLSGLGFCRQKSVSATRGLNRFKLAETWFKPAKTVKCSLDKFFWYVFCNLYQITCQNQNSIWQCNGNLLKHIHCAI